MASQEFYDECRGPEAAGEPILPDLQAEYDFVLRKTKAWLNELFIRLRRFAVDLNQPTADNPIRESLAPLGEKVTETELLGLLSGAHSKEESIARGLMLIETRPTQGAIDHLARTVADTFALGLRENWRLLEQLTTARFADLQAAVAARGASTETARLAPSRWSTCAASTSYTTVSGSRSATGSRTRRTSSRSSGLARRTPAA